MKLLNDGIHHCRTCEIYKEYGEPCSSQPELSIPVCKFCDTRMCCLSPALALMPCEENTILDRIDNEDEYTPGLHNIPFNRKTNYCKHMDTTTMNCKVYPQRPIACRIAGENCKGKFWIKTIKAQHEMKKKPRVKINIF